MKTGGEATISCPNHLDLGGSFQNEWHTKYRANQSWIGGKIDTKYQLRVQECSVTPHLFDAHEHLETLSAGYPFYFLSSNKDA